MDYDNFKYRLDIKLIGFTDFIRNSIKENPKQELICLQRNERKLMKYFNLMNYF